MKTIQGNPHVDDIVMPENLRIGLIVAEQRKKCKTVGCAFDYYSFAFGQSPFHVPPPLVKALAANAHQGHYSAAEGILELRTAIAGFNKRHFALDVDPARIVVGSGTKDLIFTIFTMITGHVIIPSPSWIGYYPQCKLLGKDFHTFYLRPEDNYRIQPNRLDDFLKGLAVEKSQHLLVLNNPNNPTGVVYSKDELCAIAEVCRRHNILVLADEIYALSTYNINEFTSMGSIYPEGTYITNGLSKDRSAGGYRLGACILPETSSDKLAKDFAKIAATVYTNVSTPTQYAAITAYEPNQEIEEYFFITREIHRMMGHYMSDGFNQIAGIRATRPQGAFYFYADFNELAEKLKSKGIKTSNELGKSLLGHPQHIATVTGDAVMLQPDNYGARIAFVDYDGRTAFEDYRDNPPLTKPDEIKFVEKHGAKMIQGIKALQEYIGKL